MMIAWMSQKGNVAMVENIAQYLDEDVEVGLEVERKKMKNIGSFRYRYYRHE